jgi:hypothetical protein
VRPIWRKLYGPMPALLLLVLLAGCAFPRSPLALARVSVCLSAETSAGPDWTRPTRGAQSCVEFEPLPPPETEPEEPAPVGDAGAP